MKTRGEDRRQTQRNTVKKPVEMCRAKNVSITTRDIDGGVVKDSECKAIDDREDGSAFDGDGESEDGGDSLGNVDGTEDLEKFTEDGLTKVAPKNRQTMMTTTKTHQMVTELRMLLKKKLITM